MSISKTLKIFNKKGSVLAFTNYGASLKSWNFELNENNKVDVVLGYGDELTTSRILYTWAVLQVDTQIELLRANLD